MAQEMVLIPKEEYESLLTELKLKKRDNVNEQKQHNADSSQANAKVSLENDQKPKSTFVNSSMLEAGEDSNWESASNLQKPKLQMKGTGKTYVRRSIEEFLKLASQSKSRQKQTRASRSKKNMIRYKWVPYKLNARPRNEK